MGLGKTVQTISFLAYLAEIKHIKGPHLIVCPLTVTFNWRNELNRFFPACKVKLLSAKFEIREEDLNYIHKEVEIGSCRNLMWSSLPTKAWTNV